MVQKKYHTDTYMWGSNNHKFRWDSPAWMNPAYGYERGTFLHDRKGLIWKGL